MLKVGTKKKRYNNLSSFLKVKFGCKVYKVSLKADFTCPNRDGSKGEGGCIYCNPEILTPNTYSVGMTIKDQLKEGIAYIKRRHKTERFISYLHSYSNTYGSLDTLNRLYYEAIDSPDVVGLAVSTRPDCIDDRVLELFSEIGREKFFWVEFGLQTSKDETLRLINRGHGLEDFLDAYEKTVSFGVPVCVHVILGLPGESEEDMLDTARLIGSLQAWGVKIHHLEVLRGTRLEEMYKNGDLRLLGFEEYASLVVKFLEYLSPDTLIHRLCSDTPKRYLVAPEWNGGKFRLIREIEGVMEKRDILQGDMWLGEKQFHNEKRKVQNAK